MPKPDPRFLDPGRYPFSTDLEVRFGDMDLNRHVNNVAMTGFVEEGRVRFHRASGFHAAIAGIGSMVASMAIEFLGQARYPGTIQVHAGAESLGRTSYQMDLLLCQDDRTIAFARSVMVCTRDGQPHPIPDSFRSSVTDWMVRS